EILMRRLTALLPVAIALALLWSAPARAQSRGKEIVVGLGAEPRTMLAVTIVDWTTNNMLEHMYDRLLDRDAKTFKPKPMLADSAALTNALMMPANALKELGPQKLAEKPIGTGPFRFVEWKRDERLVLERNPDYWQGPADASRVTFRFIPEFSARMAALLSGEVDIMTDVPPHAVAAVGRSGRARL